jgi:hypothetical protein
MTRDDSLHDERFDRDLRTALRGDRAPRAWVEDALAVPAQTTSAPAAPRTSLFALLVPHLLGLGLLVALLTALLLRPELGTGLTGNLHLPSFTWLERSITPLNGAAALFTLLVGMVIAFGAGGFSRPGRR